MIYENRHLMIRYIIIALIVGLMLMLIVAPVLAISNPDSITLNRYKVFENVLEDDDMLFIVETNVYYATIPTDYDASGAFSFDVMNESGNTTLATTSLNDYGDRPISIYLTSSQVASLSLVSGTAYILRVMGNPLIFASTTGNTVNVTLAASDYIDQDLGDDGGVASENNLRNYLLAMAKDIQDNDEPINDYVVTVQGIQYISTKLNPSTTTGYTSETESSTSSSNTSAEVTGNVTEYSGGTSETTSNTTGENEYLNIDEVWAGISGADIFIEGISAITTMCPILFESGLSAISGDKPDGTGAYAAQLSALNQWGETTARGLSMLGEYLGINEELAGSLVLFILVALFAVVIYKKTESGIAVLLLVAVTPFVGAYLGLMPMALAFIFVIVIVVLMGYFFYSRGAL